jgi:hypothetical protein
MKKRSFLFAGLSASLLLIGGYTGYRKATVVIASIGEMQERLTALKSGKLISQSGWAPYKVFVHLAQSIEYSMTGYPEMKSEAFQQTAGKAAFFVFSTAGAMRHNLSEPIPGAPAISDNDDVNGAIDSVIAALQKFENYQGEIKPHFAYGSLSKADFANAHVMHIENHLKLIQSQA